MTPEPTSDDLAVAFLGYQVTHRQAAEDPRLSLADNRMQLGYLHALDAHFAPVTALSSVPAAPGEDGATVTEDGLRWHAVARSAAGPLRPLLKVVALYRELAAWAGSSTGDRILVHYNTFLLYVLLGWALRMRYGVKVVPIAITLPYRTPDVPMSLSGRVQGRIADRLLTHVDGLVAISPFLGPALAPDAPLCVVRGAVPDAALAGAPQPREHQAHEPYRIVYAGNLSQRYNLQVAVEMMDLLPAGQYELHLYGRGALEESLRDAARTSSAITVHGVVDEQELPAVLAGADVLLALLRTDDHLARHSFPSKLFESLASGVPALTTDLPTLDETMRQHLVVLDRVDPAAVADAVVEASRRSEDERRRAATAARDYLRESATWSAVGDRLHDFLTHLEK